MKLEPCFRCGSPVEVDWTSSTEYYGMCEQSTYIACNEANGPCCIDLSISVDTNYDLPSKEIEERLIECWNAICKEVNKDKQ